MMWAKIQNRRVMGSFLFALDLMNVLYKSESSPSRTQGKISDIAMIAHQMTVMEN